MNASKVKGEFPDIIYQYMANDSMIPCHYTFTRNIDEAYFFEDVEKDEAEKIAQLLNMVVKKTKEVLC